MIYNLCALQGFYNYFIDDAKRGGFPAPFGLGDRAAPFGLQVEELGAGAAFEDCSVDTSESQFECSNGSACA
jgi:hypothetical protein